MMQLAKQEQVAKFQPSLKTSIFWALEAPLSRLATRDAINNNNK